MLKYNYYLFSGWHPPKTSIVHSASDHPRSISCVQTRYGWLKSLFFKIFAYDEWITQNNATTISHVCCWVDYSIQSNWNSCAFLHMLALSSNICRLFDLPPGSRAVSLLLSGCLPSHAQTAESASNSTSALNSMPKPSAGSTMSGFHFIRVKKVIQCTHFPPLPACLWFFS